MKTRLLIILGFALIPLMMPNIFAMCAAETLEWWESCDDMSGGSIDLDPDLSPSYASYEQQIFSNPNSVFVVVLIQLGIISLLLIIPHLILKKKKIPSRPYVILIAAAIMLFIGIPNFIQGIMILFMMVINKHLWTMEYISATVPFMVLGFVLTGGGIVLLAKSKLIRNFMERK